LRSRTGRYLLAFLALHHDRPLERDWLAGILWPDSTDRHALRNLRQTLTDLRHALGEEARRFLSPTPRSLRLDLEGAHVDLLEFDRALREGTEASLRDCIKTPPLKPGE
jgi:DNA-binding SARP family transcriptional activator